MRREPGEAEQDGDPDADATQDGERPQRAPEERLMSGRSAVAQERPAGGGSVESSASAPIAAAITTGPTSAIATPKTDSTTRPTRPALRSRRSRWTVTSSCAKEAIAAS